jgi:hypothetical protein
MFCQRRMHAAQRYCRAALVIPGPLQYSGMAQSAASIVVPGAPMLHHAQPRDFVILGLPFVVLSAIDQVDDVVHLTIGGRVAQPLSSPLSGYSSRASCELRRQLTTHSDISAGSFAVAQQSYSSDVVRVV